MTLDGLAKETHWTDFVNYERTSLLIQRGVYSDRLLLEWGFPSFKSTKHGAAGQKESCHTSCGETQCFSKKKQKTQHSSLLISVQANCYSARHWGNQACKSLKWCRDLLTHWKQTLPLGLIISVSPVKLWDLWRTLSLWMVWQGLHQKQRSL